MAGINKVILVGRLGTDPEVRALESGVKVTRLSVATSESYTKDGNKIEQTEWHKVTMWRQLAEIAEKYLSKGDMVYIEGKLRTRSWKDAEGNDKYVTEIVADQMQMLGGKSSSPDQNQNASANQGEKTPATASNEADDDLPF